MERGLKLEDILLEQSQNKIPLATFQIEAFDLTTDPCLPKPLYTEKLQMTWLILVILFCALSCMFDAYSDRWRSKICNLFYPDQSHTRAVNLHKRIRAGRGYRRIHLEMIILKEKHRSEKLLKICPIEAVKNFFAKCTKKSSNVMCQSCLNDVKRTETIEKEYQNSKWQKETVILCKDCQQDV